LILIIRGRYAGLLPNHENGDFLSEVFEDYFDMINELNLADIPILK
tara:strand:- start:2395 stop:2532 length:138 start_codon:yes stop_codon:yes gene_type:complete